MTTVLDSTLVNVRNLSDTSVSYQIPEDHRRVVFRPNETKKIAAGELRKLYFKPGGQVLLLEYLNIDNQELRYEFNIPGDVPEYEWTLADVDQLMRSGSIDALKDALEFGPEAIREAIIDYAINKKISDNNKRKAIEEMTGVQVDQAIRLHEEAEAALGIEDKPVEQRTRRVSAGTTTSGRRVQS
jgi:hypothetical protein